MSIEESRGYVEDFPAGMRVLAIDDSPTCLKLLESLLTECHYNVTTTNQARVALKMMRENKDEFDLVISGVHMPDMDGFKLLELFSLETDLPVILSGNSDPQLVMKAVTHGACDYLVKPIQIENLRNIWQHVISHNRLSDQTKAHEFVWTIELHMLFVQSLNHLRIENTVPEEMLDMMNVQRPYLGNCGEPSLGNNLCFPIPLESYL